MLSRKEIKERLALSANLTRLDVMPCGDWQEAEREALESCQQLAEWLERLEVKADSCSCPGDGTWACIDCYEAQYAIRAWLEGEG